MNLLGKSGSQELTRLSAATIGLRDHDVHSF